MATEHVARTQVYVLSERRCVDCGLPLVWTEVWQGADCVVCVRRDRDEQAADIQQLREEKARLAIEGGGR